MNKFNKVVFFVGFFVLIFMASFSQTYASTPFYSAYTTLNNARFSFLGTLGGDYPANSTVFTLKTAGVIGDKDSSNLFPNDTVCLKNPLGDGCTNEANYNVSSINSSLIFRVGAVVPGTLNDGDNVISSQSARITVTFVPRTPVPAGGKVIVTIQGNGDATTNADGIPDIGGFDAGDITGANIAANAGDPVGFIYSGIGYTNNTGNHVVTLTTSAIGVGTTCSFTIGSDTTAAYRFINPAPPSTQTVGVGIAYGVTIETQDAALNTLDQIVTKVVTNDGVLVSANVEMSLNYTIGGVSIGTTACNTPSSMTTTATAVPFNSITAFNAFYDAAQTHEISTNANSGYTLTIQQDNSLTDSLGSGATIPETTCQSSACTSATPTTWTDAVNFKGFGYSVDHLSGNSDEAFTYVNGYKPLNASPAIILSRINATESSKAYTCYRLAISTIQPVGYYFNKLTYVATPRF